VAKTGFRTACRHFFFECRPALLGAVVDPSEQSVDESIAVNMQAPPSLEENNLRYDRRFATRYQYVFGNYLIH
jgi:hypothetical protein